MISNLLLQVQQLTFIELQPPIILPRGQYNLLLLQPFSGSVVKFQSRSVLNSFGNALFVLDFRNSYN